MTEPSLVPKPALEQVSTSTPERSVDQPNEPLTEAESGKPAPPHIDELMAKAQAKSTASGEVGAGTPVHPVTLDRPTDGVEEAIDQTSTMQALLNSKLFNLAEAAKLERLLNAERQAYKGAE